MTKIYLAEDFSHSTDSVPFWRSFGSMLLDAPNAFFRTNNGNTNGLVKQIKRDTDKIVSSFWFMTPSNSSMNWYNVTGQWYSILSIDNLHVRIYQPQHSFQRYTKIGVFDFQDVYVPASNRYGVFFSVFEATLDSRIPLGRWQNISFEFDYVTNHIKVWLFNKLIIDTPCPFLMDSSLDRLIGLMPGRPDDSRPEYLKAPIYVPMGLYVRSWVIADRYLGPVVADSVSPDTDIFGEVYWEPNSGTSRFVKINNSTGTGDGDSHYNHAGNPLQRDLYGNPNPNVDMLSSSPPIGLTVNTVARIQKNGTKQYTHVLRSGNEVLTGAYIEPGKGTYTREIQDFTDDPETGNPWLSSQSLLASNPGVMVVYTSAFVLPYDVEEDA